MVLILTQSLPGSKAQMHTVWAMIHDACLVSVCYAMSHYLFCGAYQLSPLALTVRWGNLQLSELGIERR